ncbi:MAG TPA: response regulator [Gemmataceae bacterium]|nr:response regulator [Gemmataceae bacterium]
MLSEATPPCNTPCPSEGRPCVLLVDDDPDVAHTISSILSQEHYDVVVARGAGEAVAAVTDRAFDVVLIELALAETDGLSLLAEMRKIAPTTCYIVLTSYASLESAIAALRRGAYDYIAKPCVIEDLQQTIRQAIAQRRLRLLAAQRERQLQELNDQLEARVLARTAELMQANQRLAEANAAKDRFLATLSHELRTPLTPLRAGIDLLRARLTGGEWQAVLDAMERNLAQETRLIGDLLDVARITAGKLSLEKRAVNVAECLRNAVEMIQPRAVAKEQAISLELRDVFPPLLADPERLQQLIANLLDNAVKFSPTQGRIRVSVWLSENQVALEVVDSGPGIHPDHLTRVFEPFWQADLTSRRQYGGTGLGLAIAREIALLHDGELRADNAIPGPGAYFSLRFPVVSPEVESPTLEPVRPPAALRILLVDDSLDTIQVLSWLLATKGMRVREVASVAHALEAVHAEKPDVIITDIGMPEQNGYDLLRQIRAQERLRDLPVIAATGYVGSREQKKMAEAGFSAALSKPFDLSELLATLERICPAVRAIREQPGV